MNWGLLYPNGIAVAKAVVCKSINIISAVAVRGAFVGNAAVSL